MKALLKLLFNSIITDDVIVACILWSLDKLTIDKIRAGLSNSVECEAFDPKGDFLVRPGAIVAWIDFGEDIIDLVEYWGCLDRMQIIILPKHKKNDILCLISNANYVYTRHSFNTLDELMKFAKVIVNDTGDGEEFEIVFHKRDKVELTSLLNSHKDTP
ncbi:MAG: hypothetical protein KGZ54_09570 [Dethiobacter sp.]|nr:hypothetical protein [Dethiobacter sp.]MBS3902249.1 hypothetical protein [Dethiobacter sp.]